MDEKESMELWNKNLLPKINVGLATMGMTNSSPANQIKQNSFNDVMKALNKQKQENKLQHYKNSINDFRLGQKEKAEKAQLKLDSMGVGSNHLTKHSGELQNLLKRKWLDDQVAHDLIQAEYDAKDMENKQINEQAMQQQQEEYNHYHDTHNKLMGNKVNTDGPGNVLRGATQTNQQIPGPSGFGITGELIGNITKAGMQMYNDAEEKRHRRNMEIAAQMPNHNNQTNRP